MKGKFHFSRAVILHSVVIVLLLAGSSFAVPAYTVADNPNVDISIRVLGAGPSDSDADYRWYWSEEDRFDIEFESVFGSEDIADGSEWTDISSALGTWGDVSNASIASSLGDFDGDWGPSNGDNEIAWVENEEFYSWTTIGGFGFPTDAIAAAVIFYEGPMQLETDIFFNGEYFSWYTDTDDSGSEQQHVEHIALHELGHAFSLADLYDSADSDRTMYGYSGSRDEDTTLDAGDMAALEYAYPIPEPITVLLVSLGGVLVRRKRR